MSEILDHYNPRSHPMKEFFARRRVSQIVLANYLSVSQPTVSQFLNGYREMPPEVEETLEKLAAKLREDQCRDGRK